MEKSVKMVQTNPVNDAVVVCATFLDLTYEIVGGHSYISLLFKNVKSVDKYLFSFDPYFFVDCELKDKKNIEKIEVKDKEGKTVKPKKVEVVEREVGGVKKKLLKVICNLPLDILVLKRAIPFKHYESRILFVKRFLIDYNFKPFSKVEFNYLTDDEGNKIITKIISIKEQVKSHAPNLSKMAFDIETYNPLGASRESKDPTIMISYFTDKGTGEVLTYKSLPNKKFVRTLPNEKEMIIKFTEIVKDYDPDIVYGYNSTNFDIPYLKARSDKLGCKFELGRWKSNYRKIRKGMISGLAINGRIHIDLYPMMRFMGILGIIKSKRYTLEAVSNELGGKKKKEFKRKEIWKIWDSNDSTELEELAEYSLIDSEATYGVGKKTIDLFIELSKLIGLTLFETTLSTSGQLVEFLLMRESVKRKMIIPPKPIDSTIKERLNNPIEGAFVKLPSPGIYENIVVLDFRGLYPSIIISYNIDPYTITNGEDEDAFISPMGWRFRKKPAGLIPSVLKILVDERVKIKRKLKTLDKNSKEYTVEKARSNSYKIISNSFYGYLGYARSRWYNRKCAESVTSWGRKHIQDAIMKAEKSGFKVIYGDTDSTFLLMNKKSKKDVLDFLNSINKSLPEDMELELEGFYPTGVFVGKRTDGGKKGAKKKYAMLMDDGSIKIRGFELVRRDWSPIARYTQKRILEVILKEKDKEKAARIVRDVIARLKSGKVPMEELVVYTQIKKDPKDYDLISPEVSVARKLLKKGIPIQKGSVIGYVIGKKGKSISEKAEPIDFVKDYDSNYYIDRQIIPSVMKILKELGFNEDDLKVGGKQTGLDNFF